MSIVRSATFLDFEYLLVSCTRYVSFSSAAAFTYGKAATHDIVTN